MKRIIAYDTTLGVHDQGVMNIFKLKKGDVIDVEEKDKYSRMYATIQGKRVYAYWTTIDRISNKAEE